jgi:hypothetical protein
MPYTQTPGRGNFDKTGNGLPGTLNSGSAANTSIDPPVTKSTANPKGYNPATSPVPNLVNKSAFPKTLDSTDDLVILRSGDKKEISRARKGSVEAAELERKFNAEQSDTNARRFTNTVYLAGRQNIGMTSK